jgi:Asp-tRNA(Asn)/Glu-tRNA(Gln) amidotransferase A subunit family amidase
MSTRREFLARMPVGLLGAWAAAAQGGQASGATQEKAAGAAPAFNTSASAGPEVTDTTFAQAEKLARVTMSTAHREMAASNWSTSMAGLLERRTGPRTIALTEALAPATHWDPRRVQGVPALAAVNPVMRYSAAPELPLPADERVIAYAPLVQLAAWIRTRRLTSERLTRIYLDRLQRFDPVLRCVITLMAEPALAQARRADREIAAGSYRGPLHGIPWGAKDLLDTAGVRTTYGAEPFRDRVPKTNAVVVDRLDAAGAVLVAKLSMGALALNDIWFGGQTMNPWLTEEGSGGSSAGPGAATAAGLVAFAIGSETEGSILDPAMRCGVTGLRPTFGRVPRTGAMTLCWSLDKLGVLARSVEDTMHVLQAIAGADAGDVASVPAPLGFDADAEVRGLRIGYFPDWMQAPSGTAVDGHALQTLRALGLQARAVTLPDWPYDNLNLILFAEAAAAFEQLTLDGGLDALRVQSPDAWPNLFREARFLSAVDYVQADRFRRMVAEQMARLLDDVDLLLVPTMRDEMLVAANFTGHPALVLRAGFVEIGEARSDWAPDSAHPLPRFMPPRRVPYGVTLIGRLFDEGTIARVALALERRLGVASETPQGF